MTTNLLRMKVLHNKNVKSLFKMSWGIKKLPRNHLLIYYFEDVCMYNVDINNINMSRLQFSPPQLSWPEARGEACCYSASQLAVIFSSPTCWFSPGSLSTPGTVSHFSHLKRGKLRYLVNHLSLFLTSESRHVKTTLTRGQIPARPEIVDSKAAVGFSDIQHTRGFPRGFLLMKYKLTVTVLSSSGLWCKCVL